MRVYVNNSKSVPQVRIMVRVTIAGSLKRVRAHVNNSKSAPLAISSFLA